MDSKETIINNIRKNLANWPKVDAPEVPDFDHPDMDLLAYFKERLITGGGTWHEVNSVEEAKAIIEKEIPNIKVVCSATPEWEGNKQLELVKRPQELEDVDLGVIRAEFGVAEMGMIWLTEDTLKVNSLGYLSQHLAILLDPKDLTENMHTAYKKVDLWHNQYGVFMMGPSATADIEATLVHGAQGCRSLTVFFLARPENK